MSAYRRIINHIQNIFKLDGHGQTALHVEDTPSFHAPAIIPRAQHSISRRNISKAALKVLYGLHKAGYQAFVVGGGVRDLLLDRRPKDFDIATNAHPDEVRSLFGNCRLIGRRFRLAHVHFGHEIIEVATFRALHNDDDETQHGNARVVQNGLVIRDNVYGTFEEDAARRDFTINALYYNIADFSIVDFHNGMADLQAGIVRLIGDPIQRYREDPVRMLRALRFVAKLGLKLEKNTEAPLFSLGGLLQDIPPSRLFDETQKLFLTGHAEASLRELQHYDLLRQLMPYTAASLNRDPIAQTFVVTVCQSTDQRVKQHKKVTPAFLCAALLWHPYLELAARYQHDEDVSESESQHWAGHEIFRLQNDYVAVPKRLGMLIRDIWLLQTRMNRTSGKRTLKVLHHASFRAAYDFLLLRAAAAPELKALADWWTAFYKAEGQERDTLIHPPTAQTTPATRRRKRRRRKKTETETEKPHED
jgi:poly(A) polymerase